MSGLRSSAIAAGASVFLILSLAAVAGRKSATAADITITFAAVAAREHRRAHLERGLDAHDLTAERVRQMRRDR